MRRPGIFVGALVGLLLTAPLIVVSALANQLAGLPFIPYDVFPFIRDLTPGPILTFTIDTMVGTIRALNLGRVDEAAKVAEQAMSILMLIGIGIVAGALFFAVMRRSGIRRAVGGGFLLGLLVGIPIALISRNVGLSSRTDNAMLNMVSIIVLFVVWGLLHGWVYDRLTVLPDTTPTPINAASMRKESL